MSGAVVADTLSPYVPRLLAEWDLRVGDSLWEATDATCCFVDISGFTALSERLARRGRIGAEELTEILNQIFSRMLSVADEKGGSLLKFGGDALLLVFTRGDHAVLATEAAVAMRAALREARNYHSAVGRINLRMSVGLHTGDLLLFRLGASHKELIVSGPVATMTTEMEHTADAGEILVSPALAARLAKASIGPSKGPGFLLRARAIVGGGPGPGARRSVTAASIVDGIPRLLRGRLAEGMGESEHRIATVGFVKFSGVDDYLSSHGVEATAEALDTLVRVVQTEADAEGVTFLASDIDANGGKLILTSGVPTTQDDDEGRMLRASTAILRHALALPVCIGVNAGHVFVANIGTDFRRTFTVMGDTVNLAARLMAAASPGQVLATAGVLERSGTHFRAEPRAPFMVKGKSEPVQAYEVGEAIGTRSLTSALLPFRGRDAELEQLVDTFTPGPDGRSGVALVVGERGSGKSRLINEFLITQPSSPVFVAQGEPNGSGVPYLPLRAPLRAAFAITSGDKAEVGRQLSATVEALAPELVALVPLLAPLLDADVQATPQSLAVAEEFARDQVGELLVALLDHAFTEPVIIVLEDTHWFDDSSGDVCARLAEASRTRQWKLCATRRPGDDGIQVPADVVIELGLLDERAAGELVEAATHDAPLRPQERDGIISRAGGNPLFLAELLRIVRSTDVESLPDTLDAIAMREIDSLSVTARRILRLASVLGRSFDTSLLERLLEEDHLEGLTTARRELAGLLVGGVSGQTTFRHAVLQEAAYQSLAFRTRLALHVRAGLAIEADAADLDDVAPVLSLHFLIAQDWDRVWRYGRQAAEVARRSYGLAEVVTHLERAATAARHLDYVHDHDVAELLTELGETLLVLGEYEHADDAFRRCALATGRDPLQRARTAERRAHVRRYQGRLSAAIRQLRIGSALMEGLDGDDVEVERTRATILAREAEVRNLQGRLSQSITQCNAAIANAERVDELPALALALAMLDVCLMQMGRLDEATHMNRALEIYEELGDRTNAAATLAGLGAMAYYETRWDLAVEYYSRSAEMATAAGDLVHAAIAQANLGEIRVNQGRLVEAEELLVSAQRTLESFRFREMSAWALMQLGRARALSGEIDEGVVMVRSAMATFDDIESLTASVEARANLGEILVFGNDIRAATDVVAEARGLEKRLDETPLACLLDRVEVTIDVASENWSDVAARLDGALARARTLAASYELFILLTLAGRLEVDFDRGEAARLRRDLGIVELPMLKER